MGDEQNEWVGDFIMVGATQMGHVLFLLEGALSDKDLLGKIFLI